MKIAIHQAICGEQNKAWELLRTTLDDNSLAKKIAFQTDLQDSPPSGVQWLPIVRGFLFADFYLLIKTYPDNSPDVRNGRVFSHCLIINKADLKHISDLSPLLSLFKTEMDKTIQLEQIYITSDQYKKVILKDALKYRFNKVIQSFIKFTNNAEPIIWVGQEYFEIAVCKLWQLLSTTQKESFNFGINFNPNDIIKDNLSFLAIPDNTENKYENKEFSIIGKKDSAELKELSEQFLAGEQDAIVRTESFVRAIEAETPSLKEISTIAKGIPTFENLEKERDLKLLNTLSNIIAKYSPNDNKGAPIKLKLVERIAKLIENADESDIFLLRNFQTKSFKSSEKNLSSSIDKWISNYLLSEKQNQKINYVPLILRISEAPQSNWLVKLITKKISSFLSDVNEVTAKIIWLWITNDVRILKIIAKGIENTKTAENFFYNSLPKVNNAVFSEVKTFSLSRKWFRLHATIVKSQFDFETAIKEYLKVDSDKNNFEGIEIIIEGIKPKDLLAFTVFNGDERCIQLSGRLCKKEPKLLNVIQLENTNWQALWLTAINLGNKVFEGIKEPLKTTNLLLDLLVNDKPVNGFLLEKISETEFANVLNYPNRLKLWSKLPLKSKSKFLEKTSSALLQALSNNSTYPVPSDTELFSYILSDAISVFLYHNRSSIKNVLPIFNTYSQLPENILYVYISNYYGRIDVVDGTQLGQLVYVRNYIRVAEVILSKAYSSKSFKQALSGCYRILYFFQRAAAIALLQLSDTSISVDEWWSAFIQLSFNLYDEGPTQNKIWTQADGKAYDLETKGSGKEVWIAALRKLRKGQCAGNISVKKLLKAMHEENKRNEELKTLKNLWNKI